MRRRGFQSPICNSPRGVMIPRVRMQTVSSLGSRDAIRPCSLARDQDHPESGLVPNPLMATEEADPHPLAERPGRNALAEGLDPADHFMARDAGVADVGSKALDGEGAPDGEPRTPRLDVYAGYRRLSRGRGTVGGRWTTSKSSDARVSLMA